MTRRTCIAIIDASRARLFVHERTLEADRLHDHFDELADLVNPGRRLTTDKLFTDTRHGTNRMGGRHFGFDDHRIDHLDNMDAQFAQTIVAQIARVTTETGAHDLILCASPHMLGLVRAPLAKLRGLRISELARDLTKLDRHELRQRLAEQGLLPELPARLVYTGT